MIELWKKNKQLKWTLWLRGFFFFFKMFLFIRFETSNWHNGRVKERASSPSTVYYCQSLSLSALICLLWNIVHSLKIKFLKRKDQILNVTAYKVPENKNVNDMLFLIKIFYLFQWFGHDTVCVYINQRAITGFVFLFLPCEWGSNSGHQAWYQVKQLLKHPVKPMEFCIVT